MKLNTWQTSLLLAIASYIICILAQTLPLGLPLSPFPSDLYNQIELIGFVSGVVGVYLMVKESAWNYPVGLIWAIAYAWYFFSVARHLGESAVMIITAIYLIDGWIKWARKSPSSSLPSGEGLWEGVTESLPITHLKPYNWLVIGITLAVAIPILIMLLIEFRGNYVYFDAVTTSLVLTAQYLTNRKILQSWYFWIAANAVIIPVFIIRAYYPTAILYTIFTVMAFIGIKQWKASLSSQSKESSNSDISSDQSDMPPTS